MWSRSEASTLLSSIMARSRLTATTASNTANYAVRILALNARGDADDEYNVSAFLGFELIDTDGIPHDASLGCAGCPEAIGDVDLVRGGRIEGLLYFEVPDDVHIVELRYAPLWSTNAARIWLR